MAGRKVSADLLNGLRKFSSCDIGDALVKLKVPYGGFLAGLRMFSPRYRSGPHKFCGPAHTVRMVHASDTESPAPKIHFADSIPPGSVVFISQPKGLISACWGGLMSTRAQALGAAGIVIDGKFRDINEHREMGMGLAARGISILGSNTFTRSSEINVSVTYEIDEIPGAKVQVSPGDIIVGDADGVVAVPVEALPKCIELCQDRLEIDQKTMECLRRGEEIGPTIKKLRK